MIKQKALFILHHSPPVHGAAKIGDTILNSELVKSNFDTRFIKILSSKKLSDIRKFSVIKIFYFIKLFLNILSSIVVFRPQKVYFTVSPNGKAFYRDLILSLPIKFFNLFIKYSVFYHYHSKGISDFTKSSSISKGLTSFFVKNVHIIFISKYMKNEISGVFSYNQLHFLNNGVEQQVESNTFEKLLENRNEVQAINVLFLSNMMLAKGYDTALELAKKVKELKNERIKFHFAGKWFSEDDRVFFNSYVEENDLNRIVMYHGFVHGEIKKELFQKSDMLIFPSKNEVFPLTILEALSYGIPVLAFNVGAIVEIVTNEVGIISTKEEVFNSFIKMKNQYLNKEVSLACRKRFLDNYTTQVFEQNLVAILKLENEH